MRRAGQQSIFCRERVRLDRLARLRFQPKFSLDNRRCSNSVLPVLANSLSAEQDLCSREEGDNGVQKLGDGQDSITRRGRSGDGRAIRRCVLYSGLL